MYQITIFFSLKETDSVSDVAAGSQKFTKSSAKMNLGSTVYLIPYKMSRM